MPAATRSHRTMASKSLVLTPSEGLVRRCLLDCRNAMQHSVAGMKDLEFRFAGGWVRDKLLGKQSHDIDVALSTMTGEQFGDALTEFMKEHGQKYLDEAEAQGIPKIVKALHTIQKNPELSKHLETATTRMFGLDMDFVNLRKEVYNDESRNPQMEFGEPAEDAMRRDATVNALFYHLDKQVVEDLTERGLDDMENKIIRTPLEPYQTFRDDPLRVLRLIRFAGRLNYTIEPIVYEAMNDKRIHDALRIKISRERVGVEVSKIMAGADPLTGLMYICDRDLFETVFANPTSSIYPNTSKMPEIYRSVQTILDEHSAVCLVLKPRDDLGTCWFLATYVPWRNSASLAIAAAREGIKAANVFTRILGDAIKNRSRITTIVQAAEEGNATRVSVGNALRSMGLTWRFQVFYSLLCDIYDEEFEVVMLRYSTLLNYVNDQDLADAAVLKPIINGNEVMKILGVARPGSWLKAALDMVVDWQFENPGGGADEARAMIISRRGELNIG